MASAISCLSDDWGEGECENRCDSTEAETLLPALSLSVFLLEGRADDDGRSSEIALRRVENRRMNDVCESNVGY